ncbi:zf-MIZ-domain-containing protein [Trichoderma longibrachiatum ATCC 18648]|uniref:Zf-MIZ-domain-containing protein n=1 Tax=Trichoderma longibrachiatum ATCC 18648 TaxID=983965 RepID=A0A2T4BPZ2_TRILO|nr:zf-MIZ-domain-containing protein [Trichoderma longibrachiatum ATCC 18648]
MASSSVIQRNDVSALLRQVQGNSLFNRQLSTVCQVNGLKSTGVKAELQRRIVNLSPYGSGTYGFSFKPSPFYTIEVPVSGLPMAQHRNSVTIPLKLSHCPIAQRCIDDKSYRIMVFCASDNSGVQDVAFPHQSELRVNGDEIKANLRGLKNKPGSTRPVDITSALRLKRDYMNNIEFTYALTTKVSFVLPLQKYYLIVNLCKVTTVPDLVATIASRSKITEESVIRDLNKIAQDPDVVATSQVLSLKCPLSYMRLEVPCRSVRCTHLQCFDATSYLQLQEQGPQWLCPICNKPAPFEQLAVDGYVKAILEKTPKSLETVTIEPNGKWFSKPPREEALSRPNGAQLEDDDGDDDDEDDDVEVSEIIIGGRRPATPKHLTPYTDTPGSTGHEGSATRPRGSSHSAKRPAPAVIDLTLSSDDEEPIQRPSKRQHTGASSYRGSSNLPFLSESPSNYTP